MLPHRAARLETRMELGVRTTRMLTPVLLAGGAWLLASVASGHGGAYRGPGDSIVCSAVGGGCALAPARERSPGCVPLQKAVVCDWAFWWEFNKDAFLRPHEPALQTDVRIDEAIVPALRSALSAETDVDMVTSCLIALAKIGDRADASGGTSFGGWIAGFLSNPEQEIAETAALALGIQGRSEHVPLLASLLRDSAAGREAVARPEVGVRTRAFAAYALGLVGQHTPRADVRARIVRELFEELRWDKSAESDVRAACVIALGLVPDDTARRDQIQALLAYFEDERSDPAVRAHCPTALARLSEASSEAARAELKQRVATVLLSRCEKGAHVLPELVRGCVIALGSIGDGDDDPIDERIRDVLFRVQDDPGDELASHLACVALASAMAKPGEDRVASELNAIEFARHWRIQLQARRHLQAWIALGAGIFGRSLPEASEQRAAIGADLVQRIESDRSPSNLGAYAIALGVLDHKGAIEPLRALLAKLQPDDARGYCCVALGMLGAVDAVSDIQSIVAESKYRPELLKQAGVALGLLGDEHVVPRLLTMLEAAKSQASHASAAWGVGWIGDARSVNPLLMMLHDEELTERTRAYAAVALGLVADDEREAWNTAIAVGLNYPAATETLNHPDRGTGILNIL